tara:strand:- start:10732 stop:12363 length:1632 start_codon:yes stop_codon:yes gene_type:complete
MINNPNNNINRMRKTYNFNKIDCSNNDPFENNINNKKKINKNIYLDSPKEKLNLNFNVFNNENLIKEKNDSKDDFSFFYYNYKDETKKKEQDFKNENKNYFRRNDDLSSNDYLDYDNYLKKKHLKQNSLINTNMNRRKSLLQYLDEKEEEQRKKEQEEKERINTDNEVTDILLKYLLQSSERDYYKKYDDPYLTGYSPIRPRLKPLYPIDDEDKNIIKEKVFIDASIDNLVDLIELCDQYPLADNVEYNINMKAIHNIKPILKELQGMIGMKSIKENIIDQILYFVQGLHNISPNDSDYMHTVIYGPPGTGKTEVAKIMGKIFSNLGMLKRNVFRKVTRDDLVAGYLGQTAIKTKDVIHECLGGVLFIDEAYALGNKEKKDSFSKESIDTICEALSDHKKDLMCIIAGYEDELKECFFSFNPGLESRFTWKFNIDTYTPNEMKQIFEKKINDNGWSLKEEIDDNWFEKNKEFFTYYGRDMETLFSKVKIAHSRRVFCLPKEEKTKITIKDLEKGFEIYKKMGNSQKRLEEIEQKKLLYNSLYC